MSRSIKRSSRRQSIASTLFLLPLVAWLVACQEELPPASVVPPPFAPATSGPQSNLETPAEKKPDPTIINIVASSTPALSQPTNSPVVTTNQPEKSVAPSPVLPTRAASLGQPPAIDPYMVAGTISAYNQPESLINLKTLDGKVINVKLTDKTVIVRQGQMVKISEVTVGEQLTASGQTNAQGDFEAVTLNLGILKFPRPVGNPGFPNEKG